MQCYIKVLKRKILKGRTLKFCSQFEVCDQVLALVLVFLIAKG